MAIPRFAFTLAETLITIGMIGLIAVLTLPTLMNSTSDKERVARVKKVYSTLTEAHNRAVATYGPVATWFNNDTTAVQYAQRYGSRISEFLNVEKDCGMEVNKGCLPAGWKRFNDISLCNYDIAPDAYKIVLSDGAAVALKIDKPKCNGIVIFNGMSMERCGYIDFDIDGKKGKNEAGVDAFTLVIGPNRIYPNNNATVARNYTARNRMTGWVLMYDNMDYLQADSTGKCPNGTVLDWDTNTTCN
ncbi:MAG: Tfp pilus assembly protein FimT/FimU [Candidatus Gastranaerophilaceae bacterium]